MERRKIDFNFKQSSKLVGVRFKGHLKNKAIHIRNFKYIKDQRARRKYKILRKKIDAEKSGYDDLFREDYDPDSFLKILVNPFNRKKDHQSEDKNLDHEHSYNPNHPKISSLNDNHYDEKIINNSVNLKNLEINNNHSVISKIENESNLDEATAKFTSNIGRCKDSDNENKYGNVEIHQPQRERKKNFKLFERKSNDSDTKLKKEKFTRSDVYHKAIKFAEKKQQEVLEEKKKKTAETLNFKQDAIKRKRNRMKEKAIITRKTRKGQFIPTNYIPKILKHITGD